MMQAEEIAGFRSGFVSITGRPNVGKSTFLNTVLGQKVAIVTDRPQTTRNRILGIKNLPNAQVVFIDTPGIHKPQHGLGAYMVREARSAIREVEIVLYMVEPKLPAPADRSLVGLFRQIERPVFLVINKIDTLKKARLLPVIDAYRGLHSFEEIFPISAMTGEGVDLVLEAVVKRLPEGTRQFPEDMVTDMLERQMVAEIIREKVMMSTGQEVPHAVAVEVILWQERESGVLGINANIYVEKEGQKGIIIGDRGSRLKEIGTLARADIEALLDTKVFLDLWVKVKKDWRIDKSVLADLGFR